MTRPRLFTPFDWIMLFGALIVLLLIFIICRPSATASSLAISEPTNNSELVAGSFFLRGKGQPGQVLDITQDDVSLGSAVVGPDGNWEKRIPSVGQGGGSYTFAALSAAGQEVQTRLSFTAVSSSGAVCDKEFFLSLSDNQTLSQPFQFGGDGKGTGYVVTVKRGERVIGTKEVKLDATCGWGYRSNPGVGPISYEVREVGTAPSSEPLSRVNLTIR